MNKKEMRSLLSEAVEKWNPKKDKELKNVPYYIPSGLTSFEEKMNIETERIKLQGVIKFDA